MSKTPNRLTQANDKELWGLLEQDEQEVEPCRRGRSHDQGTAQESSIVPDLQFVRRPS